MRVIGLTGGIATGKSTVARLLAALGAHVIDADVLARDVVAPGTEGLSAVAARFPGVVAGGQLDRAKLAEHIFSQPEEREALNQIIHPRVRQGFLEASQALAAKGVDVVIYDVPLLFETKLEGFMSGIIVVRAPKEVQRARLIARNGLTPEQADARIAAQWPLEEKVRRANWLIDNSGTLQDTEAQVRATWASIQSGSSGMVPRHE
jgi:dephospho-CoA kinase